MAKIAVVSFVPLLRDFERLQWHGDGKLQDLGGRCDISWHHRNAIGSRTTIAAAIKLDRRSRMSFPNPARNAIEAMSYIEVGSCAFAARSEAASDHVTGKIADTGTNRSCNARAPL